MDDAVDNRTCRGTSPPSAVDRPVDAEDRRKTFGKPLVALAWRPVEISLSPGTGTGREGDLLDEEGGGRPRLTSGSRVPEMGSEVWTGERSSAPPRSPAPRRCVLSDQGTTRRGSPALAGPERSGQSRRDTRSAKEPGLSDQDRPTTRSEPRAGGGPERSGLRATRGSSTQVPSPSDRERRARWGSSTEVPGPSDRARSPTEGTRSAQVADPSDRDRRPRGASSTQAVDPSDRDRGPRGALVPRLRAPSNRSS